MEILKLENSGLRRNRRARGDYDCLFNPKKWNSKYSFEHKNWDLKNRDKLKIKRADRVKICAEFICLFMEPSKTWNLNNTSYGFKHMVEKYAGHYVCNDDFIDACIFLGVEYKDKPGSKVNGFEGSKPYNPDSVDTEVKYGANRYFKLKWKRSLTGGEIKSHEGNFIRKRNSYTIEVDFSRSPKTS